VYHIKNIKHFLLQNLKKVSKIKDGMSHSFVEAKLEKILTPKIMLTMVEQNTKTSAKAIQPLCKTKQLL